MRNTGNFSWHPTKIRVLCFAKWVAGVAECHHCGWLAVHSFRLAQPQKLGEEWLIDWFAWSQLES